MNRQWNKYIQCALKITFLVIFICYSVSISFFYHSHIIDGITIVHSHPYKADGKGKPLHTHTGAEVQLIQVLSSWSSTGKIIFTFTFKALPLCLIILTIYEVKPAVSGFANYLYLLRAPPAFYSY